MAEKEKVKFFTRVGNFFRGIKGEIKKIVWQPWKQVKKNTAVVLVVVIACAIIIGVLDFTFSEGLVLLQGLFK